MKPFKPPSPMATNGLILLCVAVQGALLIGGRGFDAAVIARYGLVPARISAVLAGVEPAGSLGIGITHMFLHSGLLHLGLNMLFLAWVGRYVEWVTGKAGLLALFVAGGLIGGAAQWFADPASMAPVIGASGAIAGVIGAYAVRFPTARITLLVPIIIIPLIFRVPAVVFAAVWFGIQLLQGAWEKLSPGMGGGIAWWAHIGGFVAGLALLPVFLLFAPAQPPPRPEWRRGPWDLPD